MPPPRLTSYRYWEDFQAEALHARAGAPRQLLIHPEANHSFTRHRPWLRQTLRDWLVGLEL